MIEHPSDPKDDGGKVPGFTYAWMIPVITRVARRHGYAIAVHGSMSKDLDLIAVPWVENANTPEGLLADICQFTGGTVLAGDCKKPHGRRAYTIVFKEAWHYIDLGIMELHNEPHGT